MKKKIIFKLIILVLLICSCSIKKNGDKLPYSNQLGSWYFQKMENIIGKKIDTIFHPFGIEIANGPIITFKSDGSFTKLFSQSKIDSGQYSYNSKLQIMTYYLYVDSNDNIGKYLIKRKSALKYFDENYYEKMSIKMTFDNLNMTFFDKKKRRYTYKKED
jgi:hypothetical protein